MSGILQLSFSLEICHKVWKYGTQCILQLFAQSLDLLLLVVFLTPAHRSRGPAVRAFSCIVDVLARAGFAPAVFSDRSNCPVRTIWCLVHTDWCLVRTIWCLLGAHRIVLGAHISLLAAMQKSVKPRLSLTLSPAWTWWTLSGIVSLLCLELCSACPSSLLVLRWLVIEYYINLCDFI